MNPVLRFCVASLIFLIFQPTNASAKGKSISASDNSGISTQSPDRIFVQTNTPSSKIGELINLETGLDFQSNFIETAEKLDAKGNLHKKFHQYYNQYEVEGAVLALHSSRDNVYAVSATTFSNIACELRISLSSEEACSKAKNHLQKENSFSPEKVNNMGLVILPVGIHGQLCYKINCSSERSDQNSLVYVNAQSGEIVSIQSLVRHLDHPSHALTHYNGWRAITVDSVSVANYRLQESGRNIRTMDHNWTQDTTYEYPYVFPSDSLTGEIDALNLHFDAEACYDYFLNQFGRHSYDDAGTEILNYYRSQVPEDAYWNGTAFVFGDGFYDQYYNFLPRTALTTYAHEYAHAFLQSTVAFVDTSEAAGISEAIANMFAIAIDFSQNPATANYRLQDEYAQGSGYDLSNPGAVGAPTMYSTGIGSNNSIADYWFYLISAGRNGINSAGQGFSVHSIGIDTTMAIVYHAILNYLTPTSNYTDFSSATIQSAIDLFGNCSNEVVQVKNAWYAVGIGNSQDLAAGFISTAHHLCTTGFVRFENTSLSASSYAWNFGDGNLSGIISPSHLYTVPGTYYVHLTVQASGGCIAIDSLVDTVVVVAGGPAPLTCVPLRTKTFGKGLQNITLQNSFPVGPVDESYYSRMCASNATLIYGDHYPLIIQGEFMNVKVWIDFNNDGNFTNGEMVLSGQSNSASLDSLTIPSTAVMSQDITMRIVTDTAQIADACQDINVGQVIDYRIRIVPNTYLPQALFSASSIYISPGDSVSFTDQSLHAPDHWSWTMTGAAIDTSTIQNPVATYYLPGVYPVILTASNANGSNSYMVWIHVEPSYVYCIDDTATSLTGMLTDIGSPSANGYSCSFLIAPSCANTITISFTLSDIYCYVSTHIQEYDYIRIYDGDNANAPLLIYSTCDEPIPPVTAMSGKALIVLAGFTSDSYFTCHWESTTFPTQPPITQISVSDSMPPLSSPVLFTSQSEYGTYGWWWNFQDGSNSFEANPVHAFQFPGDYNVTLITVQCNGGDTVNQTIHVQAAPVAVYSSLSFSENLTCNDSITRNMYVKNTGSGDLVFNLADSASAPQWIYVSPVSGLIHPGDSILLSLQFSSVGLQSGNYNDSIVFHSNDPSNQDQRIDLNFATTGAAIPELSVNCLTFNSVVQYTSVTDSFRITNIGCDTLHLTSWQFTNSDFTATVNSQVIAPGGSSMCTVHFSPQVFGVLNDTLTLAFQTGNKKICLSGSVLQAPAITLPVHLYDTLNACSGTVGGTFYIHNIGGSNLNVNSLTEYYNVGVSARILLLKDSSNFNNTYTNLKSVLQTYPGIHTLTELTQFTPANLSAQLQNTDIFVVPFTVMSGAYFTAAAPVLDQFVRQGGVVIFSAARDWAGGSVFNTGLLHGCTSEGTQNSSAVSVIPDHPILQGLLNPQSGYEVMWPMTFSDPDIIHLVKAGTLNNSYMVAFRKLEKGKAIYIGNAYYSQLTDYLFILNNCISYGMAHEYWLNADTLSAHTVAPGDSLAVNYSINVDGLSAGSYTSYITIYNSDPLRSTVSVPVTITVSAKPCADFFSVPDSCNGFVRFTDKSINSPTSWFWDFGDGGTSVVRNPVHQFSSSGTYYVKLITCNSSDCDTLIAPVVAIGPFASTTQCMPIRSGYASDGIYQVVFNTINNYTSSAYYQDFTCSKSTIVRQGGQYWLTVDFGYYGGSLRAWLDANNDGLFTDAEQVAWNTNIYAQMMQANVIIPSNSVLHTPLRLRICKKTNGGSVKPLPCDTLNYYNYQDYSVYVVPDSAQPIANYTYSIIDSCLGIIQFYNNSQNGTSYVWDFGNGQTSTDVNPLFDFDTIQYNATYADVSLTATNSLGTNSVHQIIQFNHFLPKLSLQTIGSTILCPGHTVFLYAPFNQFIPYHQFWLFNGADPFEYGMDHIVADTTGIYTLVYGNSYCSDTTDPVSITGLSDFEIQASAIESCDDDSIALSGPANMLSYLWSNGSATQTIYVHASGTYTLNSMVQSTCFASDSITLLFHPLPLATITYLNDTLYAPMGATGYQWYFNGTAISGSTLDWYHPLSNGPYSVLITDGYGCSNLSDTMMYLYAGIMNANYSSAYLNPNPATEMIEFSFVNPVLTKMKFKLIGLPGNTIAMESEGSFTAGLNHQKFDISNLAPGVYVFLAESKGGVFRQRVVIAR